jgi:16S rRNA (cytidine1402-2'-O)-methyltransferase
VGQLVLVATPIGNLGDLSARAVSALRDADAVACEDTRRTGRLLQHAGVRAERLIVVNDHTESDRGGREVMDVLDTGGTVALVSDAGTPGISDPGERLVRQAMERGHTVSGVPGPTALVLGLVLSGLDSGRFVFEGFLPRSGSARSERLASVAHEPRTVVLYEAPHRIRRTINDLVQHCGGARRVALARELTKLHEEVWRGTLDEAAIAWADRTPQGEFVVVVEGAPPPEPASDREARDRVLSLIQSGHRRKQAADAVAAELGLARRKVYELSLETDDDSTE